MSNFKKEAGKVWRTVRECLVHALVPIFMYLAMSGILLIVLQKHAGEDGAVSRSTVLTASIICGVIAVAYNALMSWGCGGTHFEQLISGNMKRRSAAELGSDLTITGYKEHKEYRPWKGFLMGFFVCIPVVVAGLLFGKFQPVIESGTTGKGAAVALLIFEFFAGWAVMPFQYLHASNFYMSTLVALIPFVVSGVFYIVGAYSKRAKVAKEQALADRKSAEQTAKKRERRMRIIGGKHRGRVLTEFKGEAIRPTADRVKESVFNILSREIAGARVLDLFCGSGALGLECISRGAKEAVFNDCSKDSVAVLTANIKKLGEGEVCTVRALDYLACLSALQGKFDIVFLDPPYRFDYGVKAAEEIARRGLLAEDGVIVYERDKPFEESAAENSGLHVADVRKYGKTYVSFLRKPL